MLQLERYAYSTGQTEIFEQDLQAIADTDLVKLHDLIGGNTYAPSSGPAHNSNGKKPPLATSATVQPNSESKDWEEEAEDVARSASEKAIKALQDLASRVGYLPSTIRDPLVSKLPWSPFGDEAVAYCKSAMLLQDSETNVDSVLRQQSSEQHFICKSCYLEISDFQSKASSYAAEDWSLLASCHVLACPSLKDRRAAYRCFACFALGLNVIEPSAAAIREHLDACKVRKIYEEQGRKKSREARKDQPSPVAESEQTAHPPPLASDTPARTSSASLHTQHASRASDTRKLGASPQRDTRDGVNLPDENRPTTPRLPVPTDPSPASADRIARPVPPLPKSMPSRTAVAAERREKTDDDSGARDFTTLPGSFPSTDSLAATTPRTPRHPNVPQPSPPTPTASQTSPASVANRTSITGPPNETTSRGRPNSSRRHRHTASTSGASAAQPLPASATVMNGASDAPEADKISRLQQLGIPRAQAESLLRTAGGDVNEAAWLACSSERIGVPVEEDQRPPSPTKERQRSRSRRWLERFA